jgi:PAS domain-containing protein
MTSVPVASWAALQAENDRLRAELAERTRERDESSERFRALVEGNADGIVVVDRAGIIQFANRRVADLFGLPMERVLGTPFGHPVASGETVEVDLIPAGRPPITVEMRVVRWSGTGAPPVSPRCATSPTASAPRRAPAS